MTCQFPTDCLNDLFEYLEDDKTTLHSCLLVNRLWCKVSVRILWRDIWKYSIRQQHPLRMSASILSTLIACLPNKSKELLYECEIFISTPTSKLPLFNYASFCKVLSICEICSIVNNFLNYGPFEDINDKKDIIVNEIVKMFTNQISSLKKLVYGYYSCCHE